MVLDQNTNFFLGKRWFWIKNLEKPTKPKKTSFGKLYGQPTKRWFFWFSLGKSWLSVEKPVFLRKMTVLDQNTNFFLEKNQQNQKKNIFWETIRPDYKKIVFLVFPRKKLVVGGKTNFFLGKRWFWTKKPQLFPRKKMVLDKKTNLFLGKNWFSVEKPTFS